MEQNKEYFAFISYQREDEEWAKWLAHELEHYHLPLTLNGRDDLPQDLRPIFRDIDELSAGNLPQQIHHALGISKHLIVICSPNSAKSPWVNKEIETFISMGKTDKIFPFIIEGIAMCKNPEDSRECFPPALRNLPKNDERLGANVNENGHVASKLRTCEDCPIKEERLKEGKQGDINDKGRDAAVVKIIAGMLGLRFDTLWQRYEREKAEEERKIREQRDNLLRVQSRFLAEKANYLIEKGDSYTARLLALEALPKDLKNPDRPYVPEAETALRNAEQFDSCVLRGHKSWVNSISLYNDILVSGSKDRCINVWNIKTGTCINTIQGTEEITSVFYDGRNIIFGTKEGIIYVWDIHLGKYQNIWKAHLLGVNTIYFCNNRIISSSNDGRLCFWNIDTKECEKQINGYRFVCMGKFIISHTKYSVYIYDYNTGELIKEKAMPSNLFAISSIALNKQIIATGHITGAIYLWDNNSDNPLCRLKGHTNEVTSVVFDGDNLISCSEDKTIRIWDIDNKKCQTILEGHYGSVYSLIITEKHIISGSRDTTIHIWDKQQHKSDEIVMPKDGLGCIVSSTKNKLITGCSEHSNKTISVWNTINKECLGTLRTGPGDPSALYCDDNIIICGSFKTIKIWDANNLSLLNTIKGHSGQIQAVAYNGELLASGSWDNYIHLWNPQTTDCISTLQGHTDTINALAFYKNYLISGSSDKTICVWNVETENCIKRLKGHEDRISSLAIAKGYIISGSWDHSIRIWNIETGTCVKIIHEHSRVFSLVFDGRYIIDSTEDSINIWHAETCIKLQTISSPITHSVTYDGKNIFVGLYYQYIINKYNFPLYEDLIANVQYLKNNRQLSSEERKEYCLD